MPELKARAEGRAVALTGAWALRVRQRFVGFSSVMNTANSTTQKSTAIASQMASCPSREPAECIHWSAVDEGGSAFIGA